jgi:SHS2 domain-containing protein
MTAAPCDYFDHDADIGIIGRGETLEACLESAAAATFAIMAELNGIDPRQRVELAFEEADPEFALIAWLNGLLTTARESGLALCRFHLAREGECWRGEAWGAPWQPGADRGTEVKGATLTMLSVGERDGVWEARCVVDV